MKKWIYLTIGVLVVAIAGVVYIRDGGVAVDVATAEQGEVRQFVEERGKTRLPRTYLVTMPYDGRIAAIDLVEGAAVKQGEVVARIVQTDLELALQEAQKAVERLDASVRENDDVTVESTGLEQALQYVQSMNRTVEAAGARVRAGEAKLDYATKTLGRIMQLRQSNTVTEEEVDLAQLREVESSVEYQQDTLVHGALLSMQAATALLPTMVRQYIARKSLSGAVLEKQRAEAEVQLRQAELNAARGVMVSPVDGVVLARHDSNERSLTAGTVLLELGRLAELEVEADILSDDAVRVAPGQAVEIFGASIGSQPIVGSVQRIYPAGFTKVSSLGVEQQRVKVVVAFPADELARLLEEQRLGLDYRVRVRIITNESNDAVTIPRTALFRGSQSQWMVFAIDRGTAHLTPVEIGLMNDERVEVLSGLAAGDQVVLTPDSNLVDGEKVKIQQ